MRQTRTRLHRGVRPALEGLEGRQLLSGAGVAKQTLATGLSPDGRQFNYSTPQGTRVSITLLGVGSLAGTSVEPNGALDLVYGGTNAGSVIVSKVSRGNGRAPLNSIQNQNLATGDLSGVGGNPIDVVNLKKFDLINGGQINLTSGVQNLYLNSMSSNSQVHVRTLPSTLTTDGTQTITAEGVSLTYGSGSFGSQTLTSVSGQFVAGPNIVEPQETVGTGDNVATTPAPPPAPPGFVMVVNRVNGAPISQIPASIGDPQIFGLDATANTLIRFDATTGAQLQTISLPGVGTPATGVALGRDNGQQVVLVSQGTNILAFNAVNGASVGQFSTANLASLGLTSIDEIGSTDTLTVVADSSAGNGGLALALNITGSLETGQAVVVGQPFNAAGQFSYSGGLTGIPASQTIFATGAAHFNTFQPDATQFGVAQLSTTGGIVRSSGMSAVLTQGAYQNIDPANVPSAVGSIDQNLAVVTGVSGGQNTVALLSPQSLSNQGTITLNDANLLTDLSESFRPSIVGSALIDVQGDVQSIRGQQAQGMIINDAGNLNLVKFASANNSVIIGQPFSHAQIARRFNLTILSTARTVDNRNGVAVIQDLKQLGPLSLPS